MKRYDEEIEKIKKKYRGEDVEKILGISGRNVKEQLGIADIDINYDEEKEQQKELAKQI